MRKNSHDRILKMEPKEHHLSTVLKSCSFINYDLLYYQNIIIYICVCAFTHVCNDLS